MRLIIVLALAAAFLGASDVEARTNASPVAAFKARANSHCRSVTSVQLGHIQAMKSAIAIGDQKAAAARYEALSPHKDECGDCSFIPVCGGGCSMAAHTELGDMHQPSCHKGAMEAAVVSLAQRTAASFPQPA